MIVTTVESSPHRLSVDTDPQRLRLNTAAIEVDGVGVLLAGSAGGGESSVVFELLRRGASGPAGEHVSILPGSRTVLALGSSSGLVVPLTIGVIVFLRRVNDGGQRLEALLPEQAATRLLDEAIGGATVARAATDALSQIAAAASTWSLDYHDAVDAAELIADLRPPLRRQLVGFALDGTVDQRRRADDPLGFALPGRGLSDLEGAAPLTRTDVEASVEGRCTGVLADQVARGRPCADPHLAQQIQDRHHAGQSTCALLERELPRLVDQLEGAGVQPVVLKGPVSAHDGPLPVHFRDFGDVDLLVPPDRMSAAVAALTNAGFERCFPQVSPDFDRRFVKSVTLRAPFSGEWGDRRAPTFEVDLHRTLTPGPFGEVVPLGELHHRAVPVRVHDRWYRALHPTHRFLHHCLHVVLGSPEPRLHSLRDLVLSAPRTPVGVDEVLATATTWGVLAVVQRALAMSQERFPGSLLPELVGGVSAASPTRRERLYLASYHRPGRSYSLPALATLAALPTWRDRIDMATMLARHRRSRHRE